MSAADFIARKRTAILHFADKYCCDEDAVRSALFLGWTAAQDAYDPARGASIDTLAAVFAEDLLHTEFWGARWDAWECRSAFDFDDADAGKVGVSKHVPDPKPRGDGLDHEPLTARLAIRERICGELHAERILPGLARQIGARLARVAAIVSEGGDREDVMTAFGCTEQHARKLMQQTAAAIRNSAEAMA